MSWTFQLAVLVLQGFVSLSTASSETCETFITGSSITVSFPLSIKIYINDEIVWKHKDTVIFKRKQQKYKPGKAEDISPDGALKLSDLTLSDGGTYYGEVFREGKSQITKSYSVCVQEKVSKPTGTFTCSPTNVIITCIVTSTNTVSYSWNKNGKFLGVKTETLTILLKDLKEADTFTCSVTNKVSNETSDSIKPTCTGKVSKPTVLFTCSPEDVTFTCNITDANMKNFSWTKNGKPLSGKTETTLSLRLKYLKEADTFTCSVANKVSNETSDNIKPTCKADTDVSIPHQFFVFDFWTMVGILAGGVGLVLIIIIIIVTLVCCRRRQKHFQEGQFRLVPHTESSTPNQG